MVTMEMVTGLLKGPRLPATSVSPTSIVIEPLLRLLGNWTEKFAAGVGRGGLDAIGVRTPFTTW